MRSFVQVVGLLATFQIYSAATDFMMTTISFDTPVSVLALNRGILAVAQGKGVRLYDMVNSRCVDKLNADRVTAVCFSSDGQLAVGDDQGLVKMYDARGPTHKIGELVARDAVTDMYMSAAHPYLCAIGTLCACIELHDLRKSTFDLLSCCPDKQTYRVPVQVLITPNSVAALEMNGMERRWDVRTMEWLPYERAEHTCYERDPEVHDAKYHPLGGRLFLNPLHEDGYSCARERDPFISLDPGALERLPCVSVDVRDNQKIFGKLWAVGGKIYNMFYIPLPIEAYGLACDESTVAIGGKSESGDHGVVCCLHKDTLFGVADDEYSSDSSDLS